MSPYDAEAYLISNSGSFIIGIYPNSKSGNRDGTNLGIDKVVQQRPMMVTTHKENIMEIRVIELLNEIKTLILGKVNERWLTIREVSEYASVSESTIRRAIKRGVLKSSNVTGRLLFKVSSVDKWLNN